MSRLALLQPSAAFLSVVCALALNGSCAPAPEQSPEFGMQVSWGLTGTSAIPEGVDLIRLVTCAWAEEGVTCNSRACSPMALSTEGTAPNCRPNAGSDGIDGPALVRSNLPVGIPLTFTLSGQSAAGPGYVGQLGPIVLRTGERRLVELHMHEIGRAARIASGVGRIMHTSTYLEDGRVLVVGGFDRVTNLVPCPDSAPAMSRCFELQASEEALALDVTTGAVETIRHPMLAARGGHSATALPDGRILIAGGAARATLVWSPQGADAVNGYALQIHPLREDGSTGAHAHFELFDPFLDGETSDPGRDGDLARGRFIGQGGGESPAPLNTSRFLHGATAVQGTPNRVLLAGGVGSLAAAESYELFDNLRPGGYGVYESTSNRLNTPRQSPTAISLGDQVWLFGGADASSNSDLAEIWSAGIDDPNGAVARADSEGQFPNTILDGAEDHPEYAVQMAQGVALGNGSGGAALVVGWYGPLCPADGNSPVFLDASGTQERCGSPAEGSRAFTVSASSGLTKATPTQVSHAFGAIASIWNDDWDEMTEELTHTELSAFTGGIASLQWRAGGGVDVFRANLGADGGAQRVPVGSGLASPRFFHTSTGIGNRGFVTIGGASFDASLSQLSFRDDAELLYLPE